MRRLFLLTIVLMAVSAPAASAKGILAAKVCGADGCETVRDRSALVDLAEGGEPTDPPAAAASFFRVRITAGERGHGQDSFWTHFVPSARLIRGSDGTWMPVGPDYARTFAKLSRGLHAYPASRMEKILAADRPAPRYSAQVSSVVEPPAGAVDPAGPSRLPWYLGGALLLLAVMAFPFRPSRFGPRRRQRRGSPASS